MGTSAGWIFLTTLSTDAFSLAMPLPSRSAVIRGRANDDVGAADTGADLGGRTGEVGAGGGGEGFAGGGGEGVAGGGGAALGAARGRGGEGGGGEGAGGGG